MKMRNRRKVVKPTAEYVQPWETDYRLKDFVGRVTCTGRIPSQPALQFISYKPESSLNETCERPPGVPEEMKITDGDTTQTVVVYTISSPGGPVESLTHLWNKLQNGNI